MSKTCRTPENESLQSNEVLLLALSERTSTVAFPLRFPAAFSSSYHGKSSLLTHLPSYQFNPHLARDETITNTLVKALTVFPSPDFSLCLHLLPAHILQPISTSSALPAAGDAPLSEAVQKLNVLNNLLAGASYAKFWSTLDSDDLYADLIADVNGFEELIRIRIAMTISQAVREVERSVLEAWLGLQGEAMDKFVSEVCGWQVEGTVVKVPLNKENEAKGTMVRENVKIDQFSRVVRRAYELPA